MLHFRDGYLPYAGLASTYILFTHLWQILLAARHNNQMQLPTKSRKMSARNTFRR